MQRTWLILVVALAVGGCGCSENKTGDAEIDSTPDTREDTTQPEPDCIDHADCDDDDPCTNDICDLTVGECHNLQFDQDGDGYTAAVMEGVSCPGDDCDDSRVDVYPGAVEVCSDGVDQDCDGIIDGLVLMTPETIVSSIGYFGTEFSARPVLEWTGDGYALAWTWFWSNRGCMEPPCHNGVSYAYLQADGTILVEEKTLVDEYYLLSTEGALAWAEGELRLVVEQMFGDVLLVTATTGGSLRSASVLQGDPGLSLGVYWNGSENTLVRIVLLGGEWGPRLTRMGMDGTIRELALLLEMPEDYPWLDVDWTGSEYGIFWRDGEDLFEFYRLDVETEDLEGPVPFLEERIRYGGGLDVIWSGSEYLSAYGGLQGDDPVIYFTRLDASGTEIAEPRVILDRDVGVRLVWAGSMVGLAWMDESRTFGFSMMTAQGDLVGERIEIEDMEGYPALEWTGSEFGIAWMQVIGYEEDHAVHAIKFARMVHCD
jgi:hypothetical protein